MFLPAVISQPLTKGPVLQGANNTSTFSIYQLNTFTSSGTLTLLRGGFVEYLLVGGGGGGASSGPASSGGGGGGGQVLTNIGSPTIFLPGTYTITVGLGGPAAQVSLANGSAGGNTSISGLVNITAAGGLGGTWNGGTPVRNGGSSGNGNLGGLSSYVQTENNTTIGSGGGGGAGGAGQNSSSGIPGTGGNGTANSITGSSITYATGGHGGQWIQVGTNSIPLYAPGTSTVGRGGPGGYATSGNTGNGSAGGAGICILRIIL